MTAPTYRFGPGVADALAEIEKIAAEFPPTDVPGSRMFYRAMARLGGSPPEIYEVRNVTIPRRLGGIGLRVYRPAPGRLPVVLFVHGGWFFLGDLETHDTLCRQLAEAAACVVVAVHYRRAPEHSCPAAPDDVLETAQWIAEQADVLGIDPAAFAIAGDSAGAALAAITAHRSHDAGGPAFCAQALLYPVISTRQETDSWRELIGAPIVTADRARYAWSMYVPEPSAVEPALVAPEAIVDLEDLPPTLVVTAEYDPLCSEGEGFGSRLQAAGVPTTVHRYPGMIHGFAGLAGLVPAGRDAIDEVGASLRAAFATTTGATQ